MKALTETATGHNWNVTFDRVTDESSRRGEVAQSGWIARGLRFRDAVAEFNASRDFGAVESNECPSRAPRWIQDTGAAHWDGTLTVYFHIPDGVTPASRRRIARLFKVN
jgi:hypothetical protein